MPVVEVNGVQLYYEIDGPEVAGDPVVMLNGVLMTVASWAPMRAELTGHHRYLFHDLRGQLLSGKPPGPYSFALHAEDLLVLLELLEIDRCHLVGTSYGGELALVFAMAHPERVRSLTLIAAVSHVEPRLRQQVGAWAEAARVSPAFLYRMSAPQNFSAPFLAAHPELVEVGAARLGEYPDEFFPAFERLVEAFLELDVTADLASIAAPTCVVCGELDALKPLSYSRTIASSVRSAELVVVADAGHAVVVEKPATVATVVLGFLAKHGRGADG